MQRVWSDSDLIAMSAFAHQAHSSTFRLIDETDATGGGSAVAVQIGSRFFLATAGHVMPKSHDVTAVTRDSRGGSVSRFAARHVHPHADVGLLELCETEIERFEDGFVTAERFLPTLSQERETDVIVIGYPGGLLRDLATAPVGENESVRSIVCDAFTFHSVSLPLREWPTAGTKSVPVPGRDIFVNFHSESELRALHPRTAGITPHPIDIQRPHPRGISGGGIWALQKPADTGVWHARAMLCGIQFGYHETGRWLRGATLAVWLEIIEANYPDLQSQVRAIRDCSAYDVT